VSEDAVNAGRVERDIGGEFVDRIHAGHVVVLATSADLLAAAGVTLQLAGHFADKAGALEAEPTNVLKASENLSSPTLKSASW